MVRLPGAVAAALTVGLVACATEGGGATGAQETPAPTQSPPGPIPRALPTSTPAVADPLPPAPPVTPTWVVGASPLPLRPDGFGQVLPTPEQLRHRSLPTADRLPPPPGGAFAASVGPVTATVRVRMGDTWSERCPVALDDLRYVTVSFVGFDERAHTGELVVAARVADDVVEVFRRLFQVRFPIEEMRLPTTADLTAPPTGDGNNTAAYVCRTARGQTRWSAHALGLAVDVNPFLNPFDKGDLVLPELARSYLQRDDVRPGMNLPGGPAVAAFDAVGWAWGGDWRSSKDWMHFSADGA